MLNSLHDPRRTALGAFAIALALTPPAQSQQRDPSPQVRLAAASTPIDTNRASKVQPIVPTERDAVDIATREYRTTGIARTVVEGNFLDFPYGHSQPTVTCSVLRACIIELQPGEVVLSRISGDTERWEIAAATAGIDGRTTLVVVKPRD